MKAKVIQTGSKLYSLVVSIIKSSLKEISLQKFLMKSLKSDSLSWILLRQDKHCLDDITRQNEHEIITP